VEIDRYAEAYKALQGDEEGLVQSAILAMGLCAGRDCPGAHAAVVILFERAFPKVPLPGIVVAMITPETA
jgi:hypothetical protein